MDVHFRIRRHIHIDDGGQVGNIQAARSHIGRHQHAAALVGKLHQYFVALALLQLAKQRQRAEAFGLQRRHHVTALLLGIAKGNGRFRAEVGEQLGHGCHLVAGGHLVPALLDLAGAVLCSHLHGLRVAHEAIGKTGNAFRIGGREQQGLAICRALLCDGDDVAEEAHVQHAIGFVQHQSLEVADVELAALHQVHHAAGCANNDVGTVLQRCDLVARGHAAIDGHDLDVFLRARQTADFGSDLIGQLARGAQHQGLDGKPARIETIHHGQAKGGGLAAAGAGLSNQVLALQGQWQTGSLNGRHLRVAQLLEVGQHFRGQGQRRESGGISGLGGAGGGIHRAELSGASPSTPLQAPGWPLTAMGHAPAAPRFTTGAVPLALCAGE